jgi:hypothetical protein
MKASLIRDRDQQMQLRTFETNMKSLTQSTPSAVRLYLDNECICFVLQVLTSASVPPAVPRACCWPT